MHVGAVRRAAARGLTLRCPDAYAVCMLPTLAQPDARARICERLRSLTANDTAQWGSMQVGEMLCHLRGAFAIAMGERTTGMPPPGRSGRALKIAALWTPIRWMQGLPTIPEIRRGMPEMAPGEFATEQASTIAALEHFCGEEQSRGDHPFFGRMSTSDWMRWGYVHTDHHLRQFGR